MAMFGAILLKYELNMTAMLICYVILLINNTIGEFPFYVSSSGLPMILHERTSCIHDVLYNNVICKCVYFFFAFSH